MNYRESLFKKLAGLPRKISAKTAPVNLNCSSFRPSILITGTTPPITVGLRQTAFFQLFHRERFVRGTEINGLGFDLLEAAAGADGLVTQPDPSRFLIGSSPFGVNRIRKSCVSAGDIGGKCGRDKKIILQKKSLGQITVSSKLSRQEIALTNIGKILTGRNDRTMTALLHMRISRTASRKQQPGDALREEMGYEKK